ncbi:g_PROTEIN_RECEP_F1_2 domain-containing protein [Caerostris darwini]|uniref:G_PROTEIN_RECEP_F1_2 domain-containing protein n=1 Tax=Caerostris darwini TaxID=1538125 RepID=A0AAV4WQP5_9ARAC|nr:g_PROTEIN_RECEP_F1_2 domain-containing protein [Caerostris darwini]
MCDIKLRNQTYNNIAAAIIFVLSSVSMAGNGLILLSFATSSHLRIQKGCYFIINLAVSDFLCAVYVMLPCIACLVDNSWCMEGATCCIHAVLNSTLISSSNMSLAAINVDRAIAINRPFEYKNLVTTTRIKIAIAYIWIHCFCVALVAGIANWTSFSQWELMCSTEWTVRTGLYAPVALIFNFILPSTLVLISNVTIIYAIRKSKTVVFQNCSQVNGSGLQLCVKPHTKTLRSLYFLVLVYFICVPLYYLVKFSLETLGSKLNIVCFIPVGLLFIAAAVNPFIYALLRKDHRKAFLETLRMIYRNLKGIYTFLFDSPAKTLQ